MFVLKRSMHNPILLPDSQHPWEALASFNWSPVEKDGDVHVFYRAMSHPELLSGHRIGLSTIGHAVSSDGDHFEDRKQFIAPEEEWEQYGCEDPRVTEFEGRYYIFYTALGGVPFSKDNIKVAVAISDDLETVAERHLVTPFNAKAMTMFPKRVGGKITVIFSAHTDNPPPPPRMVIAQFDSIEEMWSEEYWSKWHENIDSHAIELRRAENDHVEVGSAPIETDEGWLLVYSHIQDYYSDNKVFGIEAVLLDKDDPTVIRGRTREPIMVPSEMYEKVGQIENVVFPSGARINEEMLEIFYGASDSTCCIARVPLRHLLDSMIDERRDKIVTKYEGNPVITPNPEHDWESKYTFNPAAIRLEDTTYILYRAMSTDDTSSIGMALSKDGLSIDERLPDPIYVPREDFEKKQAPGYSGCEDPRIIRIEDMLYMFYTAFDGVHKPVVAATSISVQDFLDRKWDMWSKPYTLTPPQIMDKDACFFDEKINGKYLFVHRIDSIICTDIFDELDFEKYKADTCVQLLKPRPGLWDGLKVGMAGPPIKTDAGWLFLYHGVSRDKVYRVGAALLDRDDPTLVLERTTAPILEPTENYELHGQVANVVFPCGAVIEDDTIYMYYGGGDSVVAVATMKLSRLIDILTNCRSDEE